MKLSDIVGHWDLATYPKVALVIFLAVFLAVMVRIYMGSSGRKLQRYASMALEDETARDESTGRNE